MRALITETKLETELNEINKLNREQNWRSTKVNQAKPIQTEQRAEGTQIKELRIEHEPSTKLNKRAKTNQTEKSKQSWKSTCKNKPSTDLRIKWEPSSNRAEGTQKRQNESNIETMMRTRLRTGFEKQIEHKLNGNWEQANGLRTELMWQTRSLWVKSRTGSTWVQLRTFWCGSPWGCRVQLQSVATTARCKQTS